DRAPNEEARMRRRGNGRAAFFRHHAERDVVVGNRNDLLNDPQTAVEEAPAVVVTQADEPVADDGGGAATTGPLGHSAIDIAPGDVAADENLIAWRDFIVVQMDHATAVAVVAHLQPAAFADESVNQAVNGGGVAAAFVPHHVRGLPGEGCEGHCAAY